MSYKTGFKNGRLGIGLPQSGGDGNGDPLYPLDINGDIRLTGAIVKADGSIYSSGGGVGVKGLYSVQDSNTGKYKFGVGKSNPLYTLDISGSLNLDGDIYVNGVSLSSGESTTNAAASQVGDAPSWSSSVTTDLTADILAPLDEEFNTLLEIANAVQDICNNNLVINIATKADKVSPEFTGTVTAENLNITGNFQMNGQTPTFSNWTVSNSDIYRPTGNVGIGTTSPSDLLTVSSSGNAAVLIDKDANTFSKIYNNGEIWLKGGDNSNQILLRTNGNNSYFLNSNVGIGTNSPNGTLNVYKDGNGEGMVQFTSTGDMSMRLQCDRTGLSSTDMEVYYEIMPGTTTTESWKMGTNDDKNLHFGWGNIGTMNEQEKLTILNTGNVGIGTTSPGYKLDVDGEVYINNYLGVRSGYKLSFGNPGSSLAAIEGNTSGNGNLYFQTNGVYRMHINPSGNVGIGTTNPYSKLEIKGDDNTGDPTNHVTYLLRLSQEYTQDFATTGHEGGVGMKFLLDNQNQNSWAVGEIYCYCQNIDDHEGDSSLRFRVSNHSTHGGRTESTQGANVDAMTIDHTGYVGIGTTSPDTLLHIQKSNTGYTTNNDANLVIESNESNNSWLQFNTKDGREAGLLFGSSTSTAHGAITHRNTDGITFRTGGNNTRMVIDETGNVGIGTTSPGSYKLYVDGNIKANGSGSFTGSNDAINSSTELGVHLGVHAGLYGHLQIVSSTDNGGWIDFIKSDEVSADFRGRIRYGPTTGNSEEGMIFYTDGDEKLRIKNNGDIVIGEYIDIIQRSTGGGDHQPQAGMRFDPGGADDVKLTWSEYNGSFWSNNNGGNNPLFVGSGYMGQGGANWHTIGSVVHCTNGNLHLDCTNNSDHKIYLNTYSTSAGGVHSQFTITTASDDKLKHNEKKLENALETINKLEIFQYFKSLNKAYDEDHHYELDNSGNPITDDEYIFETGIIAQEIKKIPELEYTVDLNMNDDTELPPLHSVKYGQIHLFNIAATQELDRKVTALKNENAELKAKNTDLENKVATLESELAAIKAYLGI